MLLLADDRLADRRAAIDGPLAPLFASLLSELEPALGAEPFVPRDKALLSRAGGRCEIDGAMLDFDPRSPHAHRCPRCDRIHRGELHHRAWITSYQLWLAERALQAALFNLVRPDPRHASFARDVLRAYAALYLSYPNVDNVLGPTRLFFSTYLESIWLLQVCVATDCLRRAGDAATAGLVIDRVVQPSRELIATYDEGLSNRQVWNNAALLAAAAVCDDDAAVEARLGGASGLVTHLARALLADGTWYEGENYHQFALRGLWYGVTLAETRGRALDPALVERFHLAFVAPYLSALPDFTLPSRKDSQYAVSLRQWRMAELAELGFARSRDARLGMALRRCYEPGHPRGDTGRVRSTADVERNLPSSALSRADLGWRALLHAVPELPELPEVSPRSTLLEGQGLAVFRRPGDIYVGVDYGQSGGGHGHPDRLNLTLAEGGIRWLDDMGTGSYVDPSLHWFRSTLAHSAPIANGRSQRLADGELLAHEDREGLGWISARFAGEPGVTFIRSVVVAPGYLVDLVQWAWGTRTNQSRVELPWHIDGTAPLHQFVPGSLDGGDGLEDGYAHVTNVMRAEVGAGSLIRLDSGREGRSLRAFLSSPAAVTLFSVEGPGQPPTSSRRFFVVRAESGPASEAPPAGRLRAVLAWSPDVERVEFERQRIVVHLAGGERHVHTDGGARWSVELFAGGARSSIELGGARSPVVRPPVEASRRPMVLRRRRASGWLSDMNDSARHALLVFELGERHYRRSEPSWIEAGRPRATVAIGADDRRLLVFVTVNAGEPHFAPRDAANPLDNEHPDTMAAGLQLYVRSPHGGGAWMLVPEPDGSAVRVREIAGWGGLAGPRGEWRPWQQGWETRLELALPGLATQQEYNVDVDLLINETVAGRERRRGQLVASGAAGEFVFLRGDRHDPQRLLPLVIVP